jgi:carbamoyltransferase
MVEHHLSHVGSSFLCSGFKKSNVLSIDCSGEVTSTLLGLATESKITKLKEVYNPNTLGLLYAMFTQFLGFEPDNGEYKVMGLASYGKPGVNMDGLIKVNRNGTFTIKDDIWGSVKHYSDYIINRFGQPKQKGTKYGEREANLAYGIQNLLEKTVLDLIKYMKRETGEDKLCLSGGVALNCKMNGRILASDLVSDLFVPPSPGDGGCAIGSALYFYHNLGYKVKEKMEHAYYGPEFTNDQILEDLKLYGIKDYEYIDDISGECGEIVSKGGIVGWFQGKMEWGPRALGNRSIVADPRNSKIKDKINESIKFREMFRPFCPSMLDKAKEEYLEKAKESPFMILAFQVPEEKRKEIEGVVHVDGSVRPQTVKKEINPRFYKLIESFEEHTSTPIVLNTSFNVRGDPIVCDPRDALRTFYTCGLTHLAIGNYLIKK